MKTPWYMQRRTWLIMAGFTAAGASFLSLRNSPDETMPSTLVQSVSTPDAGVPPPVQPSQQFTSSPSPAETTTEARLRKAQEAGAVWEQWKEGKWAREEAERAARKKKKEEYLASPEGRAEEVKKKAAMETCRQQMDIFYPQLKNWDPEHGSDPDGRLMEQWYARNDSYADCFESIIYPSTESPQEEADRNATTERGMWQRKDEETSQDVCVLNKALSDQHIQISALQNDDVAIPIPLMEQQARMANRLADLTLQLANIRRCNLAITGFFGVDPHYNEHCTGALEQSAQILDSNTKYTIENLCVDLPQLLRMADTALSIVEAPCDTTFQNAAPCLSPRQQQVDFMQSHYLPMCDKFLEGSSNPSPGTFLCPPTWRR